MTIFSPHPKETIITYVGPCKQGDVVVFRTPNGHGTIIPGCDEDRIALPSNAFYASINGEETVIRQITESRV